MAPRRPQPHSPEELAAIQALCICGVMTQAGVDRYKKITRLDPDPNVEGLEDFDPTTYAPELLGLVGCTTAFLQVAHQKHWSLNDCLNLVCLLQLKTMSIEAIGRERSGQSLDDLRDAGKQVYQHFCGPDDIPSDDLIRKRMKERSCAYIPTRQNRGNERQMRSDGSMGGIGSEQFSHTMHQRLVKQNNPEKYTARVDARSAANMQRRHDPETREAVLETYRFRTLRRSSFRQIEQVEDGLAHGHAYMHDESLDTMVEFTASQVYFAQLGGTIDQAGASASGTLSQYVGITLQPQVEMESFRWLQTGLAEEHHTDVPRITWPNGRFISKVEAKEKLGFFSFPIFQSMSMFDCRRFEAKLQARLEAKYGIDATEILWKKSNNGAHYIDQFSRHACVYLTGIWDLQELLDAGTVIEGDHETSAAFYYG